MLLYFDKQGTADSSRIHNKTDWYILKTEDTNNLGDDNVYWKSENDVVDLFKKITNFSLNVGEIGWVYAVLHFSNGAVEEMPLHRVVDNDFKTYLVHSNNIKVEPVRLRIITNTIHTGGELKLKANPIRPRSAVMDKLYISIYNRANMKIYYKESTSLEIVISATEIQDYTVGERLYIRYHMTSKAGISSLSQEMIITGYDNLPNLSFNTRFIDASMDLLLTLDNDNYTINTWWLSHDGVPVTNGNGEGLVIQSKYLKYGHNYNLRLRISKNGESNIFDMTKMISTAPRRELYDINNNYAYKEIIEIQGIKETSNILFGEELFSGNILICPATKLLSKDVNVLNKNGEVLVFNDVAIQGKSVCLTIDNYKSVIIDEASVHVFRTNYSSGKSILENSFAKPITGFSYTVNYTDKCLYTIVGTNLIKMNLVSGALSTIVPLPNVNDKTKVLYMGNDKLFIIGGVASVWIYTTTTNRLDLVKDIPADISNGDLVLMLGMDGSPIVYDKTSKTLRTYKNDSFIEVNNSSILSTEVIKNIHRLRNGSIRFVGENKIFNYK